MNALRNSVRLTGYLGLDPELVMYGENQKMAKVSLATHEKYRTKEEEWKTDTHWHNLTFWGKNAEYAEKNLKKGCLISIEGRLVSNSYLDKEGVTRYVTEIVVNDTLVVRSKNRKKSGGDPTIEVEEDEHEGEDREGLEMDEKAGKGKKAKAAS